jgi:hypothetical protein
MDPTVLADLLGSLLEEGVDALGVTEGAVAAPERRYVAHGSVTWVALTLLRCIPTVDGDGLPSAADLDEAYRQLAVDGWAMWKHLTRQVVEGNWPEGVRCKDVTFSNLEPLAPSGGYAGWRIEIDVRL